MSHFSLAQIIKAFFLIIVLSHLHFFVFFSVRFISKVYLHLLLVMLYGRELHREHTLWYLEYTYIGMEMYIQSHRAVVSTEKMTWKYWYNSVPFPQGKIFYSNYGKSSYNVFLFLMEFEPMFLRQKLWKPDSCALSTSTMCSCWSCSTLYRLLEYPPYQREAECCHSPGQGTEHGFVFESRKKQFITVSNS